nr:gdp-man:man(3)glcnac(2)-pp-dol alpha-1,2-mannosyltransferase [Quercus suber]
MAALTTLVALIVGLLALSTLSSRLAQLVGRGVGASITSKTQQRRELLLSRAIAEEEKDNAQKSTSASTSTGQDAANRSSSSSNTSLDEGWEKINRARDYQSSSQSLAALEFSGVIGFFHPFCNAGGGGERVLFAAIHATQLRYPRALCAVYTGDHDASKDQILANVRNRFNIQLNPARLCFLYLSTRDYVLASKYPHFTLLGQSLGSLVLAWDAFNLLVPDIFIDTMGYAFVLTLAKWLFPSVPTGAYVHYPTISTDMLASLHSEIKSGAGVNAGSGKGFRGWAKQTYWELFAKLYSHAGGSIDVVMTNSSWTQAHISALWSPSRVRNQKRHAISVVYPPCAVEELQSKIPIDHASEKKRRNLLYIAQFRPEKQHDIIIDAFITFLKSFPKDATDKPKLVLVGSVRDDHDEKRVYKFRLQAQEVRDHVEFVVNAKWPVILQYLTNSSVGVNGMWNEHFGIGVVEYQAAGLISVVNDSGGPKADIVVDIEGKPTGFYASTPLEYAQGFAQALSLSSEEAFAMRLRARKSSWRFSEQVFTTAWTEQLDRLVELVPGKNAA